MFLAVVNESTLLDVADLKKAVGACAKQLKLHVAPTWDMVPPPVVFFNDKKQVPAGADILTVLDNSDQAGFLGYHRVTPEGMPYSRVFVSPILNHGGDPLTGALSVSTVLSHEICEWMVDHSLNLWADGPEGQYAIEICDPVEEDTYEIEGVSVSNFVTRRFFEGLAPSTSQFDHMNKVKKPFMVSPGGQMQVRQNGKVQSIYGAFFPDWKKLMKDFPAARSFRRRAHDER